MNCGLQNIQDQIIACMLAENLRDLARQSIGSVSLFSALVLGCTEYSIMRTKPIGGILFMIGWMAGLMIVCYAGERLMEEIVSVGAAISESQWYITDGETKKDIVFILLRSQKPIYLEAAPIGILNYALFVMILRTSYSYMTLLNQTA
ncbi:unnamed protein product [Phaedon cochleariae]|uniref:Odorant receptor n=1 Tax=Phaedon cochleariae TaxID=80249 RepID=A0A9P0DQ79_PHACE|nr:unnamed protein product [Phaedon cochleariae]